MRSTKNIEIVKISMYTKIPTLPNQMEVNGDSSPFQRIGLTRTCDPKDYGGDNLNLTSSFLRYDTTYQITLEQGCN